MGSEQCSWAPADYSQQFLLGSGPQGRVLLSWRARCSTPVRTDSLAPAQEASSFWLGHLGPLGHFFLGPAFVLPSPESFSEEEKRSPRSLVSATEEALLSRRPLCGI